MSLFCGAYLPDNSLNDSTFVSSLTSVALNLTRKFSQSLQKQGPHVDLYFLLPTETEVPDFRGMRFHSFDSKHQRLRLESSVPAHLVDSSHSQAYVLAAIKDAVENAEEFFSAQNINFDRQSYDTVLDELIGA